MPVSHKRKLHELGLLRPSYLGIHPILPTFAIRLVGILSARRNREWVPQPFTEGQIPGGPTRLPYAVADVIHCVPESSGRGRDRCGGGCS
jgi:hypothetical protein